MGQEIEPAARISSKYLVLLMLVIRELRLLHWLPVKILVLTPTADPKMVSSRTKWGGKQQALRDNKLQMRLVRPMEQRAIPQHSNHLRLSASLKN